MLGFALLKRPVLKTQEIDYDDPQSECFFVPTPTDQFSATQAAIDLYSRQTIVECLKLLQQEAKRNNGLDWLQVFDDPDKRSALWFIEEREDPSVRVTALLPEDY